MSDHCHHYYEDDGQPAKIQHDHGFETLEHPVPIPAGLPVYWDHEGFNCDEWR